MRSRDGHLYRRPRVDRSPRGDRRRSLYRPVLRRSGPQVPIGRGTRLENSVTLMGRVTIGEHNHLYPGVVIGAEPQDVSYGGSDTQVVIGDHNIIRECVTDPPRFGKRGRHHADRQPQFPHGLLPRRPRLQARQPHHHGQRRPVGRPRARARPCLALRQRGRAPLRHHRQLTLSSPA